MENIIKTKKDLRNADVVTLRNGDKLIYHSYDEEFTDFDGHWFNNDVSDLDDLKDNLMFDSNDNDDRRNDVMRVERPTAYVTVFDRTNEVREMTVEEISNILGYEVKIIKGDK